MKCLDVAIRPLCLPCVGKLNTTVYSSGYYGHSPDGKYSVSVALETKERGGKVIDRHYEVKVTVGADHRCAKAFFVETVPLGEAGAIVDVTSENIVWALDKKLVSIAIGSKRINVQLPDVQPAPACVIKTLRFTFIAQLSESLSSEGKSVKTEEVVCNGTNDLLFTECADDLGNTREFRLTLKPGGGVTISYWLAAAQFYDFGATSLEGVRKGLTLKVLQSMKSHDQLQLEDGHVYFFAEPDREEQSPTPWKGRATCLFRVQFIDRRQGADQQVR